jgi:hypothetical protein
MLVFLEMLLQRIRAVRRSQSARQPTEAVQILSRLAKPSSLCWPISAQST